jgi:hypothetical protein
MNSLVLSLGCIDKQHSVMKLFENQNYPPCRSKLTSGVTFSDFIKVSSEFHFSKHEGIQCLTSVKTEDIKKRGLP